MSLEANVTSIPGCFELTLPRFEDDRGGLVKPVQHSVLLSLDLPAEFVEAFYSRSARGVVRGLHFQHPPRALNKLVTCVHGSAFDVVLDVRVGSPTFRKHAIIGLSAARANAVVVPAGCAHGFLALEDDTVLSYWVDQEHSAQHDAGVRWDSAGIDWPLITEPIVSPRDAQLPSLDDYQSPFGHP